MTRARRLRLALVAALGLGLATPAAAIAFDTARHEVRTTAVAHRGATPVTAPWAGAASPGAQPSRAAVQPRATDQRPTLDVAGVEATLAARGRALLAGDEAGFVSSVDAALQTDMARRFASLRAMRVAVYREAVGGAADRAADGSWTLPVTVTYCFGAPDCEPLSLPVGTRWAPPSPAGGALRLVAFGTAGANALGPRPWEASTLRAAAGPRVIVATTPAYAARLPALLAAAERAAAVTDRYAKWGRPPGPYVVYLAGAHEWSTWYGVPQRSWVAAFAMPLTSRSTEVVLNADLTDSRGVADLLRHEFTHVVTLVGADGSYERSWWLVEGIAEYVRVTGGRQPFDGVTDVRRYVHSGGWAGDVAMDAPPAGAGAAEVDGRYGVAFLAVQRLADRYGEAKLLAFFGAVVREGVPLDRAARSSFGVPWAQAAADCARAVREVADR